MELFVDSDIFAYRMVFLVVCHKYLWD